MMPARTRCWFVMNVSLALTLCSMDSIVTAQTREPFYFGADLSYVNQIEDHKGIFRQNGEATDPYVLFKESGANLVRLRLWHTPQWTKEVYGSEGTRLYNDLRDVEESIRRAREQGMAILLDLHYSDTWADPGKQHIPKAWQSITEVSVLQDSVYRYTAIVLSYLDTQGLMPEFIQLGNETNCGILYTDAPAGFPSCHVCKGSWGNFGKVVNRAIEAVQEMSQRSTVKPKIILHVADPKNVVWWFDNIIAKGKVTGFDIIGFSYYPIWHTTVRVDDLSNSVAEFKKRFDKPVMILETAYPWTKADADSYGNIFGIQAPIQGYPYSREGQEQMLKKITQEVVDGGGCGVIYWEPAWISSETRDLWGKGSAWDNATLFDFSGNILPAIRYMKYAYEKK